MAEILQYDYATILMGVIRNESIHDVLSPECFRDLVITVIENGIKEIRPTSSEPHHPNLSCGDLSRCQECLLLSTLSALEALYEKSTVRNNDSTELTRVADSTTEFQNIITKDCSWQDGEKESVTVTEKWYHKVAKLLHESNVSDLLVKCLVFDSTFVSFLARKALIRGIHAQYLEVSCVLNLLKQEWCTTTHVSIPLVETLRDMMSHDKFPHGQVNYKVFCLFKDIHLQRCLDTKLHGDENLLDTHGLIEYLSLIRKIIKYGLWRCDTYKLQDLSFICEIVNKLLFLYTTCCFAVSKTQNGHLVCAEYLKAISTLLDVRFLENESRFQTSVYEVSSRLQIWIRSILKLVETNNLLRVVNFVGIASSTRDKTVMSSVSALMRQIILVALKASAFTIKGDNGSWIHVIPDLLCFWSQVSNIIGNKNGQPTKDWLQIVFSDQDDQWIMALFCLMIIHRELTKWESKRQRYFSIDANAVSKMELSITDLQETICPHKLFLQLVGFLDYDHLVLADFLMSPETPFLSYFIQYLHAMSKDWGGFELACTRAQDVYKNDHMGMDESNTSLGKSHENEEREHGSCKKDESLQKFPTTEVSLQEDLKHDFTKAQWRDGYSNIHEPSQSSGKTVPRNFCLSLSWHNDHLTTALDDLSQKPSNISSIMLESSTTVQCSNFRSTTASANLLPSLESHDVSTEISPNVQSFSKHISHISHIEDCGKASASYSGNDSGNSPSLVAYSDSDSEDNIEETELCLTEQRQNRKRQLSLDSQSDSSGEGEVVGIESFTSGSEEESVYSGYQSAMDHLTDHCTKSSSRIDSVLGMLIRLRLHIERLDYSNLFPYNVKPLLLLLEACEEVYEKPRE